MAARKQPVCTERMSSTHANNIAAIILDGDLRAGTKDMDLKLAEYRRQVDLPPVPKK